MDLKLSKEKK